MPGPGGGSSGGGFGGGSFGSGGGGFSGGGGGFGGGSFGGNHGGSFGGNNDGGHFGGHHGGPHHHGPHHHRPFFGGPFFGGWGWGRRRYVGGGCGSGLIIAVFILFFAMSFIDSAPTVNYGEGYYSEELIEDGYVMYDEATMQDYANDNYKEYFGDYDNYENNILLVFLTNDACDGYYTIAWVGDNVRYEINEMFGEYSEYGQFLNQYINTNYYAYSLDMNLSDVIMNMTESITELGLDSSFRTDLPEGETARSVLVNKTSLEMSEESLNVVLANFTEKTGIPCVIVVDRSESVFGAPDVSVTANEVSSVPPASIADEEVITHDVEAETEIIWVQPTDTLTGDSDNIAIIGGADGPTQITVGNKSIGGIIRIVLVVLAVVIAIAFVVISSKKRSKAEEKTDDGKSSSVGKDGKPPWEL